MKITLYCTFSGKPVSSIISANKANVVVTESDVSWIEAITKCGAPTALASKNTKSLEVNIAVIFVEPLGNETTTNLFIVVGGIVKPISSILWANKAKVVVTELDVSWIEDITKWGAPTALASKNTKSLEVNIAEIIDETGFPENVQYRVIFNLPNSTFNQIFILSPAENQILLAHVFDPLVILSFPLATTSPTTHVATNMISQIEVALSQEPQEPPEPNSDSYTMELQSASYLSTPEGKTINIQIAVTLIGIGATTAIASLIIKQGLTGITILNEIQDLQIGGASSFPIVFNIPDIGATGEATATLDFDVILAKSVEGFVPLARFPVRGKLVFEAPPITPPPTGMTQGSVMQKILGGLAILGSTVLLSSKGR